ncbi:MAG TPA: HAD family hydrolase [Terriglobales bacterium]|nr:HAD family hydrolase [Terriglobales bacterium]
MTRIQCSALLFDMDGVLIDSTPAVKRVWREWALDHHFDPDEVVMRAHGRPSLATVRELLPDSDYEAENRIIERREIEDLGGVVALPGAHELLEKLPENRWKIVTSATRALAEVRLRAAGLPIPEKMITATDITNGKPHPEPFLKAAALLKTPATECVVVEDAPAGIEAGREAGAKVIGISTTFDPADLRAAGAMWVLRDCTEIAVVAGPDLTLRLGHSEGAQPSYEPE